MVDNSLKDTKDIKESLLKPKKNANSIKKNKASGDAKKSSAPSASSKPNILNMLNNLPPKKTTPIKITQIKCQAPRVETSVNESKEWHIVQEKDPEMIDETVNKNSIDKEIENVEG